ncbi:hypothetical protein N7462_010573 [Penicillium macrosclerotiorum]|uniref:uncharacterized protein n=1 Tax=Penicillium macrosclerotiorum TaxID=303699 RepID=UPI002548D835|nr:uncharacterized protein N7462_010573 [Penicillium macrosclerotiorum]KAJ5669503.1 hypothetical protein N7462_010573 [Penicillium macrosclerotiorum]
MQRREYNSYAARLLQIGACGNCNCISQRVPDSIPIFLVCLRSCSIELPRWGGLSYLTRLGWGPDHVEPRRTPGESAQETGGRGLGLLDDIAGEMG